MFLHKRLRCPLSIPEPQPAHSFLRISRTNRYRFPIHAKRDRFEIYHRNHFLTRTWFFENSIYAVFAMSYRKPRIWNAVFVGIRVFKPSGCEQLCMQPRVNTVIHIFDKVAKQKGRETAHTFCSINLQGNALRQCKLTPSFRSLQYLAQSIFVRSNTL